MGRPFARLCGAVVGLLVACALRADAASSLEGKVSDDTGSPLPGVTVEVQGPALPSPGVAVTDADGRFRFDALPAGTYRVVYSLLGFLGVTREGVVVSGDPSATASADARLRLSVTADVLVSGRRTFRNVADITEPGESLVGIADASTQGAVTAEQIELRPLARAGDVLETIPGVVSSQHSGEGKANQYYLRGFNLDHGTDFATTVAGVQVNLPTHAHGHGYTDLNFVVPELVSGIQYKKGPYFVEDGDFTTAGSANINYLNVLEQPIARVDGGSYQYLRGLFADSPRLGDGNLLFAIEGVFHNGPWQQGDAYRKYNGVLRYSVGDARNGFAATFMGYSANWNATDQVPARAVEDGSLDRFETIDTTDGGESQRFSGSLEWQRSDADSVTRAVAYGLGYKLDLFSNFTYFLDDPVNGDQFEQLDDRNAYGLRATQRWLTDWFGVHAENEVGVQGRYDDIHRIGLFHTAARRRLSTTRLDSVKQWSGALFFQNDMQWAPRFRTILGLRGDYHHFDVTGISHPGNGGTASKGIVSPKLSMIFGPYGQTELYANAGYGFHSNDARGATITRDPVTGAPAERVTPLARAISAEVGARSMILPRWQSTLALWGLDIASELIFVGDAGSTEASRPSRRYGVEWSNYFRVLPWMTVDLDLSISEAKFRDDAPEGNAIRGSVQTVVAGGVSVDSIADFFGTIRLRYFGPRPLVEDASVRSAASTTVNLMAGYEFVPGLRAQAEVFNLFDAQVSDIDYFYASRLPGEPAGGVDDIHFHPTAPRSVRFSVVYGF